jgi:hypothetical protein
MSTRPSRIAPVNASRPFDISSCALRNADRMAVLARAGGSAGICGR